MNTEPVSGGHRFDGEAHAAPGAAIVSCGTRGYPFEHRRARDLQAGAGLEVDEQQGRRLSTSRLPRLLNMLLPG